MAGSHMRGIQLNTACKLVSKLWPKLDVLESANCSRESENADFLSNTIGKWIVPIETVEAHGTWHMAVEILEIFKIVYMLNSIYWTLNANIWLFGLAPNNQLRYGQYHVPLGVDDLASLA